MATITVTDQTDGSVLNAGALNEDLYDFSAGKGVFSETNGGLDNDNIDQRIGPAHLYPEALVMQRRASTRVSFQHFSDGSGGSASTESDVLDDPDRYMVGLEGGGLRVSIPRDAAALLWNVRLFVTPQRVQHFIEVTAASGTFTQYRPVALLALFINGTLIRDTARPIPFALQHNRQNGTTKDSRMHDYSSKSSFAWDFHILETGVSKGIRDIQARIYLEDTTKTKKTPEALVSARRTFGTVAAKEFPAYVAQGCGFGVCAANVMAIY